MNNEPKYALHFVDDIKKTTKLSKEDVLTAFVELASLGYVRLGQKARKGGEHSCFLSFLVL